MDLVQVYGADALRLEALALSSSMASFIFFLFNSCFYYNSYLYYVIIVLLFFLLLSLLFCYFFAFLDDLSGIIMLFSGILKQIQDVLILLLAVSFFHILVIGVLRFCLS